MKIYLNRREVTSGFGLLFLTTNLPLPIPKTAKTVKVVCECKCGNKQWVVFDDKPSTIFAYESDHDDFEVGQEYLA